MKKVLIVAGDPSGDLIASRLVEAMKKLQPDLSVTGCGGSHLERVSDRFLCNLVQEHTFGFAISPGKIFRFHQILKKIIEPELRNNPPDAVIPVDFYGFNCRVARLAKKMGRRVFYYVSPQFWASRPGRAERLRSFVDLFLCLFPFETEFYRKRNIPATFVGHPLLDSVPAMTSELVPSPRVEANIGLLPGSRPEEIIRHLPVMMKACHLIHEAYPPTRFVLFTVPHVSRDLYKSLITEHKNSRLLVDLVQDEDYRWRCQIDLAITASGMETFENTLLGIPMVVMYKMSWFNYRVAKMLVRTPYVALPNILSKEEIVPEFIQSKATPEAISAQLIRWLKNPAEKNILRQRLLAIREQFGDGGASTRAAQTILEKVA
jgi:lipid-A-disaccharide synthase